MSNMKDCDYEETSEDDSGDEEQIAKDVGGEAYIEDICDDAAPKAPCKNIVIKGETGLKDKEVIPIAREWMAFMAHIPHADADEIRQDLDDLETKYLMGLEVSSYEHIHFLVLMTEREYANIRKRLFIDKYKLRGRAVKGKPRQYGKEKEIRDLEKYCKYCMKDHKFLTNMETSEIEEIIKMKIDDVKNTKSKNANSVMLKDELVLYVETHMGNKPTYHSLAVYDEKWHAYNRLMKIKIVDFMRSKELSIRKSTIDMYFYHVVAYSKHIKMSSADIIDTLYQ